MPYKRNILKFLNKVLVVLVLLLGCLHLKAQQKPEGILVDRIVAKVDNNIVLKSDLERAYLTILSRGETAGEETKCKVLEGLVINKLLVAKADIDSVIIADEEVELSLERKMAYFIQQAGGEDKLEEFYGKTVDEFKEELMDQEREQITVQRMEATITGDIDVTPAEIRKFFNGIPTDSLPFYSKQAAVAQIVKIPKAGKPQKDAEKQFLFGLKARLEEGADFNALAREYSQEPAAKQTGGELGFYSRGQLAPEYEATALKLKPGELSDPVETDFGIHLIQLLERRGNEFNTRHILRIPQPSDKDWNDAKRQLDSIRSLVIHDSVSFEKAAKDFSDDKATASNGGYYLDETGTTKVLLQDLDYSIYFVIDSMKVGSITEPMNFRQDDGTQALRIIYLKETIKPHRASLKMDWLRIRQAALNEKKARYIDEWFLDARHEVYIDIDNEFKSCKILN